MRAIEFDLEGTASVVDIPYPSPGPDDVVVQVLSTGSCGSDLSALRGTHPFRFPPLISGHEVGGVVTEVGEQVDDTVVGQRVVVEPQRFCRTCEYCTTGRHNLCPKKQMLGIAEWDGSFAEYVRVPAYTVLPVSDRIPDYALALVEPLAVAAHAVRQVRATPEHGRQPSHLVMGGGTIGALVTAVLQHVSPGRVTVSEPRGQNSDMLKAMGASDVLQPDAVSERGELFDTVFVAAGHAPLVAEAVRRCAPGGTVVQVAVFNTEVPVPVGELQVQEIAFVGTAMYTREDFDVAAELLAERPDIAELMVTGRMDLAEGAEAITRMASHGPGTTIKLIMEP